MKTSLNPMTTQAQPAPSTKIHLLLLLLMIAAGLFARGWSAYPAVFPGEGEVRLLGVDPYFHLRQTQQLVANFPVIERHDTGTHYPNGSKNDATGLLNVLIASVAIAIYGSDASINEVAAVSVWVTFALGMLVPLLLFLMTRHLLGSRLALFAVLLFTLFPGKSLERSILGFADQHIVELCLALALSYALIQLLTKDTKTQSQRFYQPVILHPLPFIILAYSWKGAVIYLPIIALCLLIYLTFAVGQGKTFLASAGATLRFALTTLVIFALVHLFLPSLEMNAQGSRWLLYGTFALTVAVWVYLMLLYRIAPGNRTKWAFALLFATLTIVALILYLTPFGQSIYNTLFEQRLELVREQQAVNFMEVFKQLGLVAVLFIPGSIVGLYSVWQKRLNPEIIIPMVMGLSWLTIWVLSGDFGYMAPPFMAFTAALAIYPKFEKHSKPLLFSVPVIALFFFVPGYQIAHFPWIDKPQITSLRIYNEGWFNATSWLNKNTPQDDYGVISAWDHGNIIASHGHRKAAWSRYPSPTIPKWLTAKSEIESMNWLCPKCQGGQAIRYAMVDGNTFGPFFAAKAKMAGITLKPGKIGQPQFKGQTITKLGFGPDHTSSMIARLYKDDGQQLKHYRLVYETPQQQFTAMHLTQNKQGFELRWLANDINNDAELKQYRQWANSDLVVTDHGYLYSGIVRPAVKIYEIVPGVEVKINAPKDAQLIVQLKLKVQTTGREFIYEQRAQINTEGQFLFTLPYPTKGSPQHMGVLAQGPYTLYIKTADSNEFKKQQTFDIPH